MNSDICFLVLSHLLHVLGHVHVQQFYGICQSLTVGASLHHLIYNVLTDIVFPIFCHYLTWKNISGAYAQHKAFCHFNWISTGGLIDQSRKLG